MFFPGHLSCLGKELLLQKEVWLYLCRQLKQLEEPFRPLVQLVILEILDNKKKKKETCFGYFFQCYDMNCSCYEILLSMNIMQVELPLILILSCI